MRGPFGARVCPMAQGRRKKSKVVGAAIAAAARQGRKGKVASRAESRRHAPRKGVRYILIIIFRHNCFCSAKQRFCIIRQVHEKSKSEDKKTRVNTCPTGQHVKAPRKSNARRAERFAEGRALTKAINERNERAAAATAIQAGERVSLMDVKVSFYFPSNASHAFIFSQANGWFHVLS